MYTRGTHHLRIKQLTCNGQALAPTVQQYSAHSICWCPVAVHTACPSHPLYNTSVFATHLTIFTSVTLPPQEVHLQKDMLTHQAVHFVSCKVMDSDKPMRHCHALFQLHATKVHQHFFLHLYTFSYPYETPLLLTFYCCIYQAPLAMKWLPWSRVPLTANLHHSATHTDAYTHTYTPTPTLPAVWCKSVNTDIVQGMPL